MVGDGEVQPEEEPLPLDGRRKREPNLRTVRKPEHTEDFLHSYKFKNSIERRFSRSQDTEVNVQVYNITEMFMETVIHTSKLIPTMK